MQTAEGIAFGGFLSAGLYYENKPCYFPSVEAGKFYEQAGKQWLPLSLTCHHAATDGYHVHIFLETLQRYMDYFEAFL